MIDRSIVLALVLAGCSLDSGSDSPDAAIPVEPWDLVKTRTMAGELPVVGIDSDRAGGLWIAYALVPADAPLADNVRIVHVDASGIKLAEHRWTDPMPRFQGLAFSGDALWLNVASGDGNHVRKLDPVTGAQLATFMVESGITDLDVDHERGELLLSSHFNRVIALDLTTRVETWRAQLGPVEPGYVGTQSAIAAASNGRLWVASRYTDRFEVVDATRQVIASYTTEVTAYHHTTDFSLFLAWDGQVGQVIAAAENQISWLAPREEVR
jgi:hypothetical protein